MKRNVYPQPYHDKEKERKFDIEELEKELKPVLIGLIERAFRKYCKAHGAKPDVEDLEWSRFKKILNRML